MWKAEHFQTTPSSTCIEHHEMAFFSYRIISSTSSIAVTRAKSKTDVDVASLLQEPLRSATETSRPFLSQAENFRL